MDFVHRARLGDTLAAIAWDYAVPLDELLRFNGIKHPAFLWVGQEVRIPNDCSVMPPVPTGLGEEPPDAPVDVAHFSTAMKVSKALELSWKSWPGQVAEFARDAFSDPTFLVTLVMIMGVYVGLWLTPDPTMITKLLAGTLTVVLLAQFAWEDIYGLAQAWFKLGVECERATTQAQLQKAGDTFARKVGQVGFDLLLFLVMWRAGKAAEPRLRDLGLKRMEARAEAAVAVVEAKPGSTVVRIAKSGASSELDVARQRARSAQPTQILNELSDMLPEPARKGLAHPFTREASSRHQAVRGQGEAMKYRAEDWSNGPYPPYVAVVLDRPDIGLEWESWLTLELARRKFILDVDGMIRTLDKDGRTDEGGLGVFRFYSAEETEVFLNDVRVRVSALDCPWGGVNKVRGAIGWAHFSLQEVKNGFLTTLLLRTRGPVVRPDEQTHRELLRQVSFELSGLTSKYSFDDGDAFLSRGGDYMAYVEGVAREALSAAGLDAAVGAYDGTHHNPLRIWTPIRRKRDGKEVGESALDGKSMTIWAYDYSCLDDASFWW